MRIIISDASCIIDLRKAALLPDMLRLPHTFTAVNTLLDDEFGFPNDDEKRMLCDQGLDVHDLPATSVQRAAAYFNQNRCLKPNDCFAMVLAEDTEDSTLLVGDEQLQRIAESKGLKVRGLLWVIDELEAGKAVPIPRLLEALRLLQHSSLVVLPKDELLRRIRRLSQL